jgi:hypothetical protein
MSRYGDNKGRFITPKISEKTKKETTKSSPPILIHLKFVQEKFSKEGAQRKQLKHHPRALNLKPAFKLKA